MSKEKRRVPKLRFPGFTEDWEQRKLGDIATFSKGNGYSKSDLAPSGNPIILYGRLYTNYETTIRNVDTFVELKDKSIISQGGEVIVPASGETAEDISRASVVKNEGIIIGGDLNVIKVNCLLEPTFLALTISNGEQQKELSKRAQGKSVVHLHNSDLCEVNLKFPPLNEQRAISSLFENMDNIITLHQRKLEHLNLKKKALLQKLFPKEGERYPELRFPGFTDAWEQRKLGSILIEYIEKNPGNKYLPVLTSSRQGLTKQEDHFGSVQRHDISDYNVIPLGFCTYRNRSDDKTFTFNINRIAPRGLVSKFYPVFDIKNGNADFVTEYLNNNIGIIKSLAVNAVGTSQVVLSLRALKNIEVILPSKAEQVAIGNYIRKLNIYITLHQRKLEHLQLQKKALLQQMFV